MTENQRVEKFKENVIILLCLIVLSFGKINSLSPFHYAFFYASFLSDKIGAIGIVGLLLTAFFDGVSFFKMLLTVASLLPFVFYLVYAKVSNKRMSTVLRIVFCVVHFCIASASAINSVHAVNLIINGIITLSFSYVFRLCYTLLSGGVKVFVSETVLGCFAFSVLAFGAGFSQIFVFSVPLIVFVAGFAILFFMCVIGKTYGFVCALALGCGYAVCRYEITFIALFGFCALCCVPFVSAKRIFPLLSALMGLTVFELYFAVNYTALPLHLLFFALGGTVFLLIPSNVVNELRKHRRAESSGIALRYLINKNRIDTAMQVRRLKEIFLQMSSSLSFLKGDTEKVSLRLAKKTEEDVCRKCENYGRCSKKELPSALITLSRLTLIKNKATITSLPPLLENECLHLASLVGASYNNSLAIRKDVAKIATQNQVKATLSRSLSDICDILAEQEKKISSPLGFDYEREEKIKEELALSGMICKQVYIALGHDFEVTLLLKRETFDKNSIERAVSGALKIGCEITKADDSVISGWSVVTLTEKPGYSLVVSVASLPKNGERSGDTHSFTKLSDSKVMVALCDGMGSGEKAEAVSDNAISLIENFYRAGFDHDVTVKSVNAFLRIDNDESFSALDTMVFDRKTGCADIVKLASPPTFIKKRNTTVRVDASSLPIGIVNEITPAVSSRECEAGDCFVFVTDGVYDCFSGDMLSAFINNSSGKNPSLLSSAILEEAKKRVKTPTDDMTVVVCKVIIAD
ncbi:MAG: SpoIIE family protein phosphatase [Clostridia bacterium]|nr:SpoIIE family protein phosphatase [Clostridia bacterium]